LFEAVLEVRGSENYCRSLLRSISPDNVEIPPYMHIENACCREDNDFVFLFKVKVEDKPRYFDSLRGTIDEILYIIEMLDKTLTILK
jgi:hypothetical protein